MRFARAAKGHPARGALFSLGGRVRRVLWPALAFAVTLWVHGNAAADCATDRIDERARVVRVHDGDTVVLHDGRKVRLIGINTPELPREDSPGQPFAQEARAALVALLESGDEIGLRFDEEHLDRYGRLLAHLFLTGGENVQARLLRQGYAAAIAVPPNLWSQGCYRRAEERASRAGLGLWRLSYYQPLAVTRITPDSEEEGFRFVRGKVVRSGAGASAVWLNLEGGLALRIARPDLRYFPAFRPRDLVGKVVVARGWIHTRGAAPVMQIRHPSALQFDAGQGHDIQMR
jgi:micrococcal nuclease